MKKLFLAVAMGLCFFPCTLSCAEWLSIDGKPAKWGDIIKIHLRDLHPTQSALGYDRIFYKLGRYQDDRHKLFDDICTTNGQRGVRKFSIDSKISNPSSFECLDGPGTDRDEMKSAVIGPDDKLYLTDGHHTFSAFWFMAEGGPDLSVYIKVTRDYHALSSMDGFWKQMELEKNIWLFDVNDATVTVRDLPDTLDIAKFSNDIYRSLMYFTRLVAWGKPDTMSVPEAKFYGDDYSDAPFLEFYWARELRSTVDLRKFDLSTHDGYIAAITNVGQAIVKSKSTNVGGSGKTALEMGQFKRLNQKELYRIGRPGTGKVDYTLKFKLSPVAQAMIQAK
jgi:hypothetical protein